MLIVLRLVGGILMVFDEEIHILRTMNIYAPPELEGPPLVAEYHMLDPNSFHMRRLRRRLRRRPKFKSFRTKRKSMISSKVSVLVRW